MILPYRIGNKFYICAKFSAMKKIIVLPALLLGFLAVHAQNTRFGVKGGLNISTLTVSGVNLRGDFSPKTGFHVGGFVAFPVAKKLEIHPEVLFSNQGYKYEEVNPEGTYESVANLNYIAIPIMVSYLPVKRLNIEIGPQFSLLVNHKARVTFTSAVTDLPDYEETVDNTDRSQTMEVGLNAGASYFLTRNLFVSGRYYAGISTVNKRYRNSEIYENEKDRNSVFQFSIGYLFNGI